MMDVPDDTGQSSSPAKGVRDNINAKSGPIRETAAPIEDMPAIRSKSSFF